MVSVNATGDLRQAFRDAMRRLAATATIVSTGGEDGPPVGMTATSVTSLSADPPALLVCVNRSSSLAGRLGEGRRFCVSILGAGHDELPFIFGGGAPRERRFEHGNWKTSRHGVPFLDDAQSNIFCSVDRLFAYATHRIVVGRVDAVRLPSGDVRPLIFADGRVMNG